MDSIVATASCQDDVDMHFAGNDTLPVKNTFVHFVTASRRPLRVCQSDPADPALPKISIPQACKDEAFSEDVEMYIGDDVETNADCSEIDTLSIQTPEMTPRRLDSPGASVAASLESTPSKWAAPKSPDQGWPIDHCTDAVASCYDQSFAWPVCLQLSRDPALTSSTFTFTLRLAEKGVLGLDFRASPDGNSLIVQGIVAGWAVDCWNQQCVVGSAANMARFVSIGDVLVCVNGKEGWRDMVLECQERLLLKLTFARKDPCFPLPALERI
jgi:hypothetical protein